MKRKILNFIIFLFLLTAEVCIAKFADPAGIVRGSLGDVLVIPTIYFLIRSFANPFPKALPVMVFLMGCIAELLQAMDICRKLNIREGSLMETLIGTRADLRDILCYFAGMLMIYIYIFAERRIFNEREMHSYQ